VHQNLHQKHKFCTRNKGFLIATLRDIAPGIAPELFALLERISANPRINHNRTRYCLNVSRRTISLTEQPCSRKGHLAASVPARGGTMGDFSHEVVPNGRLSNFC
jgi:hypothetical protein